MKKTLTMLMAITLVISTNSVSFAAWGIDGSSTFSASVTPGGTGGVTVPFSASLKLTATDATATSITWTGVSAGTTNWLASNQYIAVKGFATFADWGVQVYTSNSSYTGSGEPAGLIRTDNTLYSLPMCWRTKVGFYDIATGLPTKPGSTAAAAGELQILEGTAGGYTVLYDGVAGHQPGGASEYFPWFFIMDKTDPDVDPATAGNQAYGNYQNEATFIGSRGYHHAPGNVPANFASPSSANDTYYVYMGAKFTAAVPGKTYSTSTLTVEMYHL